MPLRALHPATDFSACAQTTNLRYIKLNIMVGKMGNK
jgi:hypothetical protein